MRAAAEEGKGEKMSKIYRALEKAERDRGSDEPPVLSKIEDVFIEKNPIAPEPGDGNGKGFDARLIAYSEPGSVAAEQFRKLRTQIYRRNILTPFRTIMVTSSTTAEGKSFVAANIGVALARDLHAQALLIDCDLRNPTLTKWFGLENKKGLADYLKGGGDFSQYAKETGVGKLNIVPAGTMPQNPTELLGSNRMKDLVEELGGQSENGFVIMDSTPILSTTEPEVLAKLIDGIIFVVRAGSTPRETVERAVGVLEKDKILGVVLNDLTFKSSGLFSRYFGSDGYHYRYGYGVQPPPGQKSRLKRIFRPGKGGEGV